MLSGIRDRIIDDHEAGMQWNDAGIIAPLPECSHQGAGLIGGIAGFYDAAQHQTGNRAAQRYRRLIAVGSRCHPQAGSGIERQILIANQYLALGGFRYRGRFKSKGGHKIRTVRVAQQAPTAVLLER